MEKYADNPMDLADASLVTAAQCLGVYRIFTIDRNDFFTYRIAIGHELKTFELID
jgi:predicted nucleic acid-binding protein